MPLGWPCSPRTEGPGHGQPIGMAALRCALVPNLSGLGGCVRRRRTEELAAQVDEVLQQPQARRLAFLRVELDRGAGRPADGAGEQRPIVGGGGHQAWVSRLRW